MSDLDDKLKEIKLRVKQIETNVYQYGHLSDDEIAQIHQAFADEGWKDLSAGSIKLEDALKQLHVMTGQEWFDRFEREYNERFIWVRAGQNADSIVLEVAKKASGLE